jgi:hypothetical protein
MRIETLGPFLRSTAALAFLATAASGLAQDLQPITLPPAQRTGGGPLMDALNARRTTRSIGPEKLAPQVLSNLLWAAYGVNREQGPRGKVGRTAPSGMNLQPIDLYVATPDGVYLYEPVPHRLAPVVGQDVRSIANRSPVASVVPVVLVYVVDAEKKPPPPPAGAPVPGGPPGVAPPWESSSFGEVETGFIGQNVYLFCASQGLAAWFHSTDKEGLARAMNLRPAQRVLYAQTVGSPAEKE